MADFGRVFRMTVEGDKKTARMMSDGIFMVIGPSSEAIIRAQRKAHRETICLVGSGYWANGPVAPGEIIPVLIDDPRIEWLDDE